MPPGLACKIQLLDPVVKVLRLRIVNAILDVRDATKFLRLALIKLGRAN